MAKAGQLYYLTRANAHRQVTSTGTGNVQTVTLEPDCAALELSCRTTRGYLTFDGSTPSASNGLDIIAGAQAIVIPLGYNAHSGHQLKWASSAAANAVLCITQLS
jgi:hypothetical protein